MFNFKHRKTGKVISHTDHKKLPVKLHEHFDETNSPVTHRYRNEDLHSNPTIQDGDDDGVNFLGVMLLAEAVEEIGDSFTDNSSSVDNSAPTVEADFGGGSSDGGGAEGTW